tara:strand:+ start:1636 stop:2163 length:528 start_codon:yes stop_codon:yes gene_type:complete
MEIKNAIHNEYGTINVEINHPKFGWIPFTSAHDDPSEIAQEVTRALFDAEISPKKPIDINDYRNPLLELISSKSQYYVESLISTYPDFEKLTFETQKSEARGWAMDNTVDTPNVDILAFNRGIDREVLLEKISVKATEFEKLSMAIAGQRQKFEDLIALATTVEELDAINISFTV